MCVHNGIAYAGAQGESSLAVDAGAVYSFELGAEGSTHILRPGVAAAGAFFGRSLACNGKQVLVGAPGYVAGAAYIYSHSTRAEMHVLSPSDGAANDEFGGAVALHNDLAVIGARRHRVGANAGAGAVYVFNVTSGVQLGKLTAEDGLAGANFGHSVAVDRRSILVGAPKHDALSTGGRVYVFDSASLALRSRLQPVVETTDGKFGQAVALSDSTILVGAPQVGSGAAYEFSRGLVEQLGANALASPTATYLPPSGSGLRASFGESVACVGHGVLIGSPSAFSENGANSGIAASYAFGAESTSRIIWAVQGEAGESFGSSVALDAQGTLLVGAPLHSGANSPIVGGVFLYREAPPPTPPPPMPPPVLPSPDEPGSQKSDMTVSIVAAAIAAVGATIAICILMRVAIKAILGRTNVKVAPRTRGYSRGLIGRGLGRAGPTSSSTTSSRVLPLMHQRVIVTGLTGRPELNGQLGVATGFDEESQRYVVTLEGSDIVFKVKGERLSVISGVGATELEDGQRSRTCAGPASPSTPSCAWGTPTRGRAPRVREVS